MLRVIILRAAENCLFCRSDLRIATYLILVAPEGSTERIVKAIVDPDIDSSAIEISLAPPCNTEIRVKPNTSSKSRCRLFNRPPSGDDVHGGRHGPTYRIKPIGIAITATAALTEIF